MCFNPQCPGVAGPVNPQDALCPVCARQQMEYLADGFQSLDDQDMSERGLYFWDRHESLDEEEPKDKKKHQVKRGK